MSNNLDELMSDDQFLDWYSTLDIEDKSFCWQDLYIFIREYEREGLRLRNQESLKKD